MSKWQYLKDPEEKKLNYLLVHLHTIMTTLKTRTNSMEKNINMILQMESSNPNLETKLKNYMWSAQNSFDDQVECAFDCIAQLRKQIGRPSKPTVDEFENYTKYTMQLINQNRTPTPSILKEYSIPHPKPDTPLPSCNSSPLFPEENDVDIPNDPPKSVYLDFMDMLIDTTKIPLKLGNNIYSSKDEDISSTSTYDYSSMPELEDFNDDQHITSSYTTNIKLLAPSEIKNELTGERQQKLFKHDSLSSIQESNESIT